MREDKFHQLHSAAVVLVAAGKSRRMGGGTNKVLLKLNHRPILSYSLEVFQRSDDIHTVAVVSREEDFEEIDSIIHEYCPKAQGHFVIGGEERFDSVKNGLEYLEPISPDAVLIHDAARPFVEESFLRESVAALAEYSGCLVGVPAKDTIKEIDSAGKVIRTHERERLRLAQTPQSFRYPDILYAYRAVVPPPYPTDDAAVFELFGENVHMIAGSYRNIKITTPEDIIIAEALLGRA